METVLAVTLRGHSHETSDTGNKTVGLKQAKSRIISYQSLSKA